jgi:hypothetical protein
VEEILIRHHEYLQLTVHSHAAPHQLDLIAQKSRLRLLLSLKVGMHPCRRSGAATLSSLASSRHPGYLREEAASAAVIVMGGHLLVRANQQVAQQQPVVAATAWLTKKLLWDLGRGCRQKWHLSTTEAC